MPNHEPADETRAIEEIIERLQGRFAEATRETIVSAVGQARSDFNSARVRDFVPVLIEKEAKARLKGKR